MVIAVRFRRLLAVAGVAAWVLLPALAMAAGAPAENTGPKYCVNKKDKVCQPREPNTDCPKDWDQSDKCLCPDGSPKGSECIPLVNPLANNTTDIYVILGTILRVALGIVGSLALLMFVWGGFQLLTSAGSPERVKKGADTMLWAALGVVCVFASWFILSNYVAYLTTGSGPG